MRKFTLGLLAVLCLSVISRMPANAQFIPAGSYQDSCDTIQVNGGQLSARCSDIDGNWHWTSTDMNACPSQTFANNNGQLVCGIGGYGIGNTLPRGSWRASCRNASATNGMLYAQCGNDAGNWQNTQIAMYNCPSRIFDNANGNLVCRGGSNVGYNGGNYNNRDNDGDNDNDRDDHGGWNNRPNPNAQNTSYPPGSWAQSCRNYYVQSNVLYAQCSNGSGGWSNTSYNMGFNHSIPLANVRGQLVSQNAVNRYIQ